MTDIIEAKTGIKPEALQQMLDAASNAAARGQAQFFTPIWLGELIGTKLGKVRPHICDLSSGAGHLLIGASNESTGALLGIDIDPCRTVASKRNHPGITKIVNDVGDTVQMLDNLAWTCGTFVLNPPWSLHFDTAKFEFLLDSDFYQVRESFREFDGGTIDATAALILCAMHFSTHEGDVVVIANGSTMDRFFRGGPLAPLANHIWARIDAEGNLMTDAKDDNWGNEFTTSIIFLSRGHYGGCKYNPSPAKDRADLEKVFDSCERWRIRNAGELMKDYRADPNTETFFRAVKEEVDTLAAIKANRPGGYNIYLNPDGTISTYLSIYSSKSGKVSTDLATELHKLNGKTPLQLVLQAEQRQALLKAVNGDVWRVDPRLPEMVKEAITAYHGIRAPLSPLSKTQCLGYLDEENAVTCIKDFVPFTFNPPPETMALFQDYIAKPSSKRWEELYSRVASIGGHRTFWQLCLKLDQRFKEGHDFDTDLIGPDGPIPEKPINKNGIWTILPDAELLRGLLNQKPIFRAGKSYPLRSQTLTVKSSKWKPGIDGDDKEFVLTGQELAIYLKDDNAAEQCFIDSRHSHKDVLDEKFRKVDRRFLGLDDLVTHFSIPSVPDVGSLNPDALAHYKEEMREIESLIGAKFKGFQLEDISRGVMHDGIIAAWDTGLGKTWMTFVWPLLKVGRVAGTCMPLKPVLIVAPEGLHKQIIRTGKKFFGLKELTPLDCQDTYTRLAPLKPGWYITSFTQLAANKVEKMPEVPWDGAFEQVAKLMEFFRVTIDDVKNCKLETLTLIGKALELCRRNREEFIKGIGEQKEYEDGRKIKCVYSPALCDMCSRDFEAVVIDEAVRVKAAESIIGLGVRSMQPRCRLVLTATPIKNRLPDIFWLAWWATGGKVDAHARWPYKGTTEDQHAFAGEFLISEVTKEKYAGAVASSRSGRKKRQNRGKATAEVCNIHRLWKLLAPVLVRRRKRDIGEDIVKKIRFPLYVPLGKHQAATYAYHLKAEYKNKLGRKDLLTQMTALRNCAAAPHTPLLEKKKEDGPYQSQYSYIPKIAATLKVIRDCMDRGEQVTVFSAFTEPLETLKRRLDAAGVEYLFMTGDVHASVRGAMSATFAEGRPGPPVVLAGIKAMAEGHDWPLANNVVLFAYDWAYDLFEQAINRVHRLNSIADVNVWAIMCENSIDLKLEALIGEKGDAAELVLDGKLVTDQTTEVNFAKLLQIAESAFAKFDKTNVVDEEVLELDWPDLRDGLRTAFRKYKTFAPHERKSVAPVKASKTVADVKEASPATAKAGTPVDSRSNPARSHAPVALPVPAQSPVPSGLPKVPPAPTQRVEAPKPKVQAPVRVPEPELVVAGGPVEITLRAPSISAYLDW